MRKHWLVHREYGKLIKEYLQGAQIKRILPPTCGAVRINAPDSNARMRCHRCAGAFVHVGYVKNCSTGLNAGNHVETVRYPWYDSDQYKMTAAFRFRR
jgi:hypothetical protein